MAGIADDEMIELAGLAETQAKTSLSIRFYSEPIQNEQKTRAAGRPIYDEAEWIEIRIPGDVDVRRNLVTDQHKREYPKQYLAFRKSQNQEAVSGLPLSEWAQMTRGQVEEARFLGIHTVEQLAAVADGQFQRLGPGWLSIRQKAIDFLKAAESGAEVSKLRDLVADQNAKIKTLEEMLQRQAAAIQSGGHAGPSAPVDDGRIARLEAMIAGMAAAQAATPQAPARRKPGPKSKAEKAAEEAARNSAS